MGASGIYLLQVQRTTNHRDREGASVQVSTEGGSVTLLLVLIEGVIEEWTSNSIRALVMDLASTARTRRCRNRRSMLPEVGRLVRTRTGRL